MVEEVETGAGGHLLQPGGTAVSMTRGEEGEEEREDEGREEGREEEGREVGREEGRGSVHEGGRA